MTQQEDEEEIEYEEETEEDVQNGETNEEDETETKSNVVLYNCYAISNHSGTMHGGHYTAYCRHPFKGQEDPGERECWHLYNDRAVSGTSEERVVTGEAYLLFFEHT